MTLRTCEASGLEYLDLVTSLLHRARLASPVGGLWDASDLEAADLQWWWRRDQHGDPAFQRFWFDGDFPIAAFVITDWGGRFGCELISADHDACSVFEVVWPAALEVIDSISGKTVELNLLEDDVELAELASAAGFANSGEVMVTTWMSAPERPEVRPIRPGFELVARSDRLSESHHMIKRNGEAVAERLAECTLYRPDLDLAVVTLDGELAAYALFWADAVTGVGLVEPMRTEDRFQQLGLARHLLAAGLERLGARRCSRLKVSYVEQNEAARRLYLGAGFRPSSRVVTFTRGESNVGQRS